MTPAWYQFLETQTWYQFLENSTSRAVFEHFAHPRGAKMVQERHKIKKQMKRKDALCSVSYTKNFTWRDGGQLIAIWKTKDMFFN